MKNDLITSSKLLSKLLCKNNKANSTQTWGRSTTATAKNRLSDRLESTWRFRETSKEKSQNRKFRMVGRCNFYLFILFFYILINRPGSGGWHRAGWVSGNTGIFFLRLTFVAKRAWMFQHDGEILNIFIMDNISLIWKNILGTINIT